jgi:AbrB family looped-hinge helix DNA binding protein
VVGYSYRHTYMSTKFKALEYLATTKIGEKGQLTVPKRFRQGLGLGAGSPFAVLRLGDGLVLLPEARRFERLCEQISSVLTHADLSTSALLATLPEARKRVHASRYANEGSSKRPARRTGIRRRK